jgi:Zn-dependent protease
LFDIQPIDFVMIAIFLLVAFPVHEFAHAYTAYLLGDATAKLFGRLTLNPAAHFDPVGGLMTVISILFSPILFGWAKPTPVNPANLRDRRNGELLVAIAGPLSNLAMAIVGALLLRLLVAAGSGLPSNIYEVVGQVLFYFVYFNVALAIFNLIPIPPLDGSNILFRFLSPSQIWQIRPILAQYGIFIVIIVVLLLGRALGEAIYNVALFLVGG